MGSGPVSRRRYANTPDTEGASVRHDSLHKVGRLQLSRRTPSNWEVKQRGGGEEDAFTRKTRTSGRREDESEGASEWRALRCLTFPFPAKSQCQA